MDPYTSFTLVITCLGGFLSMVAVFWFAYQVARRQHDQFVFEHSRSLIESRLTRAQFRVTAAEAPWQWPVPGEDSSIADESAPAENRKGSEWPDVPLSAYRSRQATEARAELQRAQRSYADQMRELEAWKERHLSEISLTREQHLVAWALDRGPLRRLWGAQIRGPALLGLVGILLSTVASAMGLVGAMLSI